MPIRTQSLLNRYLLTPPLCTSVWCEHNYSYRRSTAGCGTCPVKVVFTESGITLTGYIILPHCVLFSCRFCFLATDHLRAVACFHLCSCCASARAVALFARKQNENSTRFFFIRCDSRPLRCYLRGTYLCRNKFRRHLVRATVLMLCNANLPPIFLRAVYEIKPHAVHLYLTRLS